MFSRIGNFVLSANTSLQVIGLMAFLPFVIAYHRLPIPSFYGEWVAAVLGILALLPLLKRESWQPLELPHISLIFPGLMAIVLIQWLLGMLHSTQYALLVASYLAWAFLLVVLGTHLRRQLGWEKITTTLAWSLLIGGTLNTLFVILQYSSRSGIAIPWLPEFSGYGAVGQVNHFANYMALATSSVIYLLAKKRLHPALAIFAGVVFLSMLAFSGSRSTWLYVSAIMLLALLFRAMVIRQKSSTSAMQLQQSRIVFRWTLVVIPIFVIVQYLIPLLPGELIALPSQRLLNESLAVSGLTVRLHIWQESLQLFMQSPWLGIGAGQIRWQSFLLLGDNVAGMPGSFEHAHNLLLHLITEMGFFAGLLVLTGILSWLRAFQWRNISLEGWWLLSLLAIVGIHSMLEYPLWYAYFLGLVTFLLGAGEEKTTQLRASFAGRAILVSLLITGLILLTTLHVANHKLEHWLEKAIKGDISHLEYPTYMQAMEWVYKKSLFSPYVELMYATTIIPNKIRLEEKIGLNYSAMRFIPLRTNVYRHVLLLELSDDRAAAVNYLRRALQAFPGDFSKQLQLMPMQYWDRYLEVLSEAVPPPTQSHQK